MQILILQTLVFLASFLIFQVELILGKVLLPGFGGGHLVWGISVVFYQGLLFLGYGYVHFINSRFSFQRIKVVQTALFALSLLLLPVNMQPLENPSYQWPVVVEIAILLFFAIGILFSLLSSVSVYSQIHLSSSSLPEKTNPYILYAGSNFGAFASLLTYPVFWEPNFSLETQMVQWQFAYGFLVAVFLVMQWVIPTQTGAQPLGSRMKSVGRDTLLKWLFLSSAPSALFLSITNEITFNIAPVPLLWILPLSIYLLTLVLAFKKKPFCPAYLESRMPLIVILCVVLFLFKMMGNSVIEILVLVMIGLQVPLYIVAVLVEPVFLLFVCFVFCLVIHYRLHEEKPQDPGSLTTFYLTISAGGFLGGVLVNWVAPLVFNLTLETLIAFLLGLIGLALGTPSDKKRDRKRIVTLIVVLGTVIAWPNVLLALEKSQGLFISILASLVLLIALYTLGKNPRNLGWALTALVVLIPFLDFLVPQKKVLYKTRSYYGVYRVQEADGFRKMYHGTTLHGAQYLAEEKRRQPLTYYHLESPMGQYLTARPFQSSQMALIGLGAGSLALYAKEKDRFDFFEIDPVVGEIAQQYFSFIQDSPGEVNLIYGDARVSLRKQPEGKYDAVIGDVFNSGAIPVHLITVEALQDYLRILKPGGLMFFHVSNQFLDLIPVLHANAKELGLEFSIKFSGANRPPEKEPTVWVLLSADTGKVKTLVQHHGWKQGTPRKARPWTDQYSSLWPVLIR